MTDTKPGLRPYDWLILLLIGALIWGGYTMMLDITAPAQSLSDPAAGGTSQAAIAAFLTGLIAPVILAFLVYLILFRGPAAPQRQFAASVMLLFIALRGAELVMRSTLLTGWSDPSDTGNRDQLYQLVLAFTQPLQTLCAFVFLALCVWALVRRVSQRHAQP